MDCFSVSGVIVEDCGLLGTQWDSISKGHCVGLISGDNRSGASNSGVIIVYEGIIGGLCLGYSGSFSKGLIVEVRSGIGVGESRLRV